MTESGVNGTNWPVAWSSFFRSIWAVRPPLLPPDLSDVKTAKDLLIILMLFELPGLPGAVGCQEGRIPFA